MKIAIMQPTFNPWIGYFDLIDYVDCFIIFDTVKLNKQSWQTRNKIKIGNNEYILSIPLYSKEISNNLIKDIQINYSKFDFRKKFIKTIEQNYSKSKYFNDEISFIKELLSYETLSLSKYNINIIKKISEKLDINTKIIVLSDEKFHSSSKKSHLVFDICKFFNATSYISPIGSKKYLDNDILLFEENDIRVEYQLYKHKEYLQLGTDFIPYLGIFDLILNEGLKNTKNIILKGRQYSCFNGG